MQYFSCHSFREIKKIINNSCVSSKKIVASIFKGKRNMSNISGFKCFIQLWPSYVRNSASKTERAYLNGKVHANINFLLSGLTVKIFKKCIECLMNYLLSCLYRKWKRPRVFPLDRPVSYPLPDNRNSARMGVSFGLVTQHLLITRKVKYY